MYAVKSFSNIEIETYIFNEDIHEIDQEICESQSQQKLFPITYYLFLNILAITPNNLFILEHFCLITWQYWILNIVATQN